MYIIDETYFNGKYHLPNLDATSSTDDYDDLDNIVNDKARLLLQNALGYQLFEDLDQYVISGVFDSGLATQKWIDFVQGKEYTLNGKTYKWQGLIYDNGGFKKSLLVPYCYYYRVKEYASQLNGIGDVAFESKNGTTINPTQRIVNAWNDFVQQYQSNCNVNAYASLSFRNGIRFIDYSYNNDSGYVSMVKFLLDNETDYPDAALKLYETQNQLGL